jgi:protein-S-isoprenylcysteine O-methyltransferase Ste14
VRLVDHFASAGDGLFQRRSWLPLLLVPLFVASFIGTAYPFGSHAAGLAWEIACFLVSAAGLALRMLTVGTSPRGTSGRNTRAQKAAVLNTTGPYSVVRHPLYLGNSLIGLGLAMFTRTWFLPLIVTLATVLYYERIAAREEQFLEARFGEAFRRWAARVPAVVPRPGAWRAPALPFSWRRALHREFYAVGEVCTAFLVLDVLEDWMVRRVVAFDPLWAAVGAAGAVSFAAMWIRKKRRRLDRAG